MVQTTVTNTNLATGIVGEFSRDINQDSISVVLNSATESLNVVGSVVHFVDGNDYEAGVAADGNIAGVLVTPKANYRASLTTAQGYINNNAQTEVATRGYIFVDLPAAADKGDFVYYSDTDGTLATAAPDTAPSAGYTRLAGGTVTKNATEEGVGEIYIDILSGSTETPTA